MGVDPNCSGEDKGNDSIKEPALSTKRQQSPIAIASQVGDRCKSNPRNAAKAPFRDFSSQRAGSIAYPSDANGLPNEFARALFEMSSIMPAEFRKIASETGLNIVEGSRGFVFNADPTALIQFFDIGTRPANLR